MYKEHGDFMPPEDENQIIWRYIDFIKFVDLLSTKELFFTRIDKFDDPYEGSNTIATINSRDEWFDMKVKLGEFSQESAKSTKEILIKNYVEQRKKMAVNCWHMNDYESDAMWKLYSNKNAGIAIKSTYFKLKESFNKSNITIYIGKVNYVDYKKDITKWGNGFIPILLKSISFKHEYELRAVIWSLGENNDKYCDPINNGIRIKVDIDVLIEEIYLAPNTQDWIKALIRDVMKKYKLDKPIKSSFFDGKPVY